MKKPLILLFIILLFSCQGSDWGQIRYTHSKTNVRKLKSVSSKIVTTLQPNQKIRVIVSEHDWWLVYDLEEKKKTRKNAIGYVHKSLLHPNPVLPQTTSGKPTPGKSTPNIATAPELKYSIVEKKDVSYLNSPRRVYRVVLDVDTIPSDKSMRELAKKLWNNGNRKWEEYTVFIYLPDMNTHNFAYARGEFRPNKMMFFDVNANALSGTKWSNSLKNTNSPKTDLRPARSTTLTKKWYEGGTLHNATITQWKNATYRNKLATAADWLAGTIWKGNLKSLDDFKKLKVKARMLVKAVDETVGGLDIGSWQVNEIAAAIVTLSYEFSP